MGWKTLAAAAAATTALKGALSLSTAERMKERSSSPPSMAHSIMDAARPLRVVRRIQLTA